MLALLTLTLGWAPSDRLTWMIEQLLVIAALAGVALVQRRFQLSASASLQLCGFLVLHQIGAHYTYSQVPYEEAWQAFAWTSRWACSAITTTGWCISPTACCWRAPFARWSRA